MLSVSITPLLAVHVLVSLLIILVVLMQRPKSEGLGAAFGGGMTENLFGAQTTNVLASFTRWLGGIFFFLTLMLSILYAKQASQKSSIQAAVMKQAAMATPTPAASPAAASGVAPLSGTSALSGSAPFGGAGLNLALPAATPTLLPAPTLGGTGGATGH